ETTAVTPDQVRRILALEEGHFFDLKAMEIAPSKLTKTIAAFANASGGELYIGVAEVTTSGVKSRAWRGFADMEAGNAHLQVFEKLFPLGQYYSYSFLGSGSEVGLVLQVSVNKSREIVKVSDGVVYLRRGAQSLPLTTADGLASLRLDKGVT